MRQLKAAGYKIVLFLGRITLQKGPDYFVRVAKRVAERNPKVMFVVSGSGDMEGSIMQLAAQLGVSDKVLFTGFVTGPERYEMYRSADLFAMPSVCSQASRCNMSGSFVLEIRKPQLPPQCCTTEKRS